ncbi:serine protease inhibitor dipetalogastin-like [Paramacrobiotus metropolitanus]|uniref:serine protease inhibitor dipetalogastin-like n=1 Tax=Paramacrobiotus metropolitanus TaxID=2943436 RepID=UPI002445C40C|nr:serine protease inhibitor dipetalogastin-like [Paramacrobiotus metropolitanus]
MAIFNHINVPVLGKCVHRSREAEANELSVPVMEGISAIKPKFPKLFLRLFTNALLVSGILGNAISKVRRVRASHCDCPSDKSQPICGTDGVTYDNFCQLRCASSKMVPGLGGRCRGKCPCEAPSPLSNLICEVRNNCPPQIPKGQLCGTDNKTYEDACVFLCAQHSDKGLGVQCGGACPCPKPESPCSKCPDEYRPLCGNNNITYGNQCMFSCARMASSALYPSCRSECPCVPPTKSFEDHLKAVFLIPV